MNSNSLNSYSKSHSPFKGEKLMNAPLEGLSGVVRNAQSFSTETHQWRVYLIPTGHLDILYGLYYLTLKS